jgi:hypothetical protein
MLPSALAIENQPLFGGYAMGGIGVRQLLPALLWLMHGSNALLVVTITARFG